MRKGIEALFPRTRAAVLSAVLLHPEKWWFLSDLAKHLHVTPSTLQRELGRLTEAGILLRRVDGKRVYFKSDDSCPYRGELQGLFIKTAGLVDVIADCLKPFRKRIELAAIFGSIARGEELSRSDVDLLIVGDLGLADLSPHLKKAEAKLQREIQAMFFRPTEFKSRLRNKDHFITSVVKGTLLPIIGSIDEHLEKIRERPTRSTA